MKEGIQLLAKLTAEQIEHFNLEKTTSISEKFQEMNKAITAAWQTFKSFDSDKSDKRTLELINNHGSGLFIEKMTKFNKSMQLFTGKSTEDKEVSHQFQLYKNMAENYLEYAKHKTQLENNQKLIEEHLETLAPKQETTCKMQ